MHLVPSSLRSVGLLVSGVAVAAAFWLAATPPSTSTVAPAAAGQERP